MYTRLIFIKCVRNVLSICIWSNIISCIMHIAFLGGAGTGMTGPQEDSNEGKLCLPLKMGFVEGGVRVKKRWRVEGVG